MSDKVHSLSQEFGHFPEGDRSPAQGCCTRLPWERRGQGPNPNRGCDEACPCKPTRRIDFDVEHLPQPRWGCEIIAAIPIPKVAEYSTLGLWVATTSWLHRQALACRRQASQFVVVRSVFDKP